MNTEVSLVRSGLEPSSKVRENLRRYGRHLGGNVYFCTVPAAQIGSGVDVLGEEYK